MNFYAIPFLIAGFLMFLDGLFIFWNNKKSEVNIAFALFSLSCTIWLFGYASVYLVKTEEAAFNLVKLVYIGVLFIPSTFYHFNMEFLRITNQKRIIKLYYLVSLSFIILLFTTPYVVPGVYKYFWGYYAKGAFFHTLYLGFLGFVVSKCLFLLRKNVRLKKEKEPLESIRVKYIFWAFAIGFSGGFQDFIPNYGIIEFYPLGSMFVAVAASVIAYTIIHLHLLDIKIVFTRIGIFTVVYALVLGIPFAIGSVVIKSNPNLWLLPMFLLALFASLGPFIYMRIQRRVEERIRKEEFKAQRQLRRLSHDMIRFSELDGLLKLIVHYLVKIYKLKFAGIYLNNEVGKYTLKTFWQLGEETSLPVEYDSNSHIVQEIISNRQAIVTEELKLYKQKTFSPYQRELLNALTGLKINVIIPSFIRNDLLGFLVLSDRKSNLSFSQEDLNLLMVLSNEAALAIENAQFHQKEKNVLAEKSRREALADMAPGASHQFNNRLASISTTSELLLIKLESLDTNTMKDEKLKLLIEDARKGLELITQEVFKGKEITSAILRRAKAKVEPQEVNVKTILENAHKLVLISKGKSGVETFKTPIFKFNAITEIPNTLGSEALLQDCFYNLFDNAFDAMNEKAALILQGELMDQASTNYQGEIEAGMEAKDGYIIISIKDNGIGLKTENMRKLFAPYFTTKATSGKGTGLGLYVIRDFIEMHKGTITCDSQYGAGTTFTIRLPIK